MSSAAPAKEPVERDLIARIVDTAPPLTESTRARLVAILRPATAPRDAVISSLRSVIRGGAE